MKRLTVTQLRAMQDMAEYGSLRVGRDLYPNTVATLTAYGFIEQVGTSVRYSLTEEGRRALDKALAKL